MLIELFNVTDWFLRELAQSNSHIIKNMGFEVDARKGTNEHVYFSSQFCTYHQVSNISRTLVNNIIDHSDVVGAAPTGAAPTTSSFST